MDSHLPVLLLAQQHVIEGKNIFFLVFMAGENSTIIGGELTDKVPASMISGMSMKQGCISITFSKPTYTRTASSDCAL
jgi:hypothetical protein